MKKKYPKKYEKRIRSGFLLFPKRIKRERRWLEIATWEEEFRPVYPIQYPNILEGYWKPIKWLE